MAGQHVLGPSNRHLRLVFKRPRTRCRSKGERGSDSTYDADVAHRSSLLAKDCLARSACPILYFPSKLQRFRSCLDSFVQPLVEDALSARPLYHIHRLLPLDLTREHQCLPLLQHRGFLLSAPRSEPVTILLDRFHRCVNLSLPAYTSGPVVKRGQPFLVSLSLTKGVVYCPLLCSAASL